MNICGIGEKSIRLKQTQGMFILVTNDLTIRLVDDARFQQPVISQLHLF